MIQLRCQVVKAVFYAVCSECNAEGPEEALNAGGSRSCYWSAVGTIALSTPKAI